MMVVGLDEDDRTRAVQLPEVEAVVVDERLSGYGVRT
jgi:hypothetical protein